MVSFLKKLAKEITGRIPGSNTGEGERLVVVGSFAGNKIFRNGPGVVVNTGPHQTDIASRWEVPSDTRLIVADEGGLSHDLIRTAPAGTHAAVFVGRGVTDAEKELVQNGFDLTGCFPLSGRQSVVVGRKLTDPQPRITLGKRGSVEPCGCAYKLCDNGFTHRRSPTGTEPAGAYYEQISWCPEHLERDDD